MVVALLLSVSLKRVQLLRTVTLIGMTLVTSKFFKLIGHCNMLFW